MRCLQRRPIRVQKEGGSREKAWSMPQGNTKKGKKQKSLQQGLLTENLAPPAGFEPVACRLGANLAVGYHGTFSSVYVHECLYFSSFFQVPYRAVFTYIFRCSCVYALSD